MISVYCLVQTIFLLSVKASSPSAYSKSDHCKEPSCSYEYILSGEMHNERSKEGLETTAEVTLHCESVGFYKGDSVKYFCLDVEDSKIQIFEVKASNQTENGNETIKNKRIKTESKVNYLMRNRFCFVRNAKGRVLSVFYPRNEKTDIVNFKKTITSAFQANFARTETEEETDAQSDHKSHYSYTEEGDRIVEHRFVNSTDVSQYSGKGTNRANVDHQSTEDIEVDEDGVVHYSHGESSTSLAKRVDEEEENNEDSDNEEQDIPPIEAKSVYTLRLKQCMAATRTEGIWKEEPIEDSLMARLDKKEHDRLEMKEIYNELPGLEETARRVTRSTDENAMRKVLDARLAKWRRILHLESQHGPLGGRRAKVGYLIKILEKNLQKQSDAHKNLRLMLHGLLSYDGSLLSQKGLLNALRVTNDAEEYENIVMSIAMLSSAHSSSVSRLKNYLLNEDGSIDEQMLLAFGTLGRHNNVASEVVMTIAQILSSSSNDTTNLPFLIHALGNTGSELIIPYVSPFLFTSNDTIQLTAIDALRTVSTHGSVQKLFSKMIDEAASVDSLMTIVDSLVFPYQSHLYYPEIVRPRDRDDNHELTAIEEELMGKIVNTTIEFDDSELYSAVKKYLKYYGTDRALELLKTLNDHYQQYNDGRRAKRSSTTDWSSSGDSSYSLVASNSSRIADEVNYPYHKAYLWTKQLGPKQINAQFTVGGFSGIGETGYKIFAKGIVNLNVYGRTYEAVRLECMNRFEITTGLYSYRYVKVAGSTLLSNSDQNIYDSRESINQWSWNKTIKSIQVFHEEFDIFVYVGILTFYIEGKANLDVSLQIEQGTQMAIAEANCGPVFSVTGGTYLTLLVFWRVGLDITAGIGYYVTPKATATLCDSDLVADESACLGIYHGSNGIDVNVYAYYRKRTCNIDGWSIGCNWRKIYELPLFSSTYSVGFLSRRLLWGTCTTCDCTSPIHEYCLAGTQPIEQPTVRSSSTVPSVWRTHAAKKSETRSDADLGVARYDNNDEHMIYELFSCECKRTSFK